MVVFRILWRLIVMAIGLRLAIYAAATVVAFASTGLVTAGGLAVAPERLPREIERFVQMLAAQGFDTGLVGIFTEAAMAPAVFVAFVAELLRIRNPLFHWIAGAAIAVWVAPTPWGGWTPDTIGRVAAVGFAAGFVYWLIAGRGAGFRRDRPEPAATPEPAPAPPPRRPPTALSPSAPALPSRSRERSGPPPAPRPQAGAPVWNRTALEQEIAAVAKRAGRPSAPAEAAASGPASKREAPAGRQPHPGPVPAGARPSAGSGAAPPAARKPVVERTSRWWR